MKLEAIGNLGHRLMLARTLPPRLVLAKIAKRLPWSNPRSVRVSEILHSPRDLRPDRLLEFYRTQEALLSERKCRSPIDFRGRNVIEIGPGPLAGWGPMAIFRGAERVYGADPDWVDGAFSDPAVEAAYLRPHHTALSEAFGALMPYEEFRTRLADKLTVEARGLDAAQPEFTADIIISNSCLEHIVSLDVALMSLADLSAPGVRFMHLVNFGNHRDRLSPFSTIYEMSPSDYRRRYGNHINLRRPSDLHAAFAAAGIEAEMTIVDQPHEKVAGVDVHAHWKDRYCTEELAVRTALFCEPTNGGEK